VSVELNDIKQLWCVKFVFEVREVRKLLLYEFVIIVSMRID